MKQTTSISPAPDTVNLFTDSAQSTSATFTELYNLVGDYLTHYRNDLIKHDRAAIEEYNGLFLYGYRQTGTTLVKLHKDIEDYKFNKTPVTAAEEQEVRELIIYLTGPLGNKKFLYYNGTKFTTITPDKVKDIWESHVFNLIQKHRRKIDQEITNHTYYNTQTGTTVRIY